MKKISIVLALSVFCYACGGSTATEPTKPIAGNNEPEQSQMSEPKEEKSEKTEKTETKVSNGKDGKALIAASDCLTCHKEHEKIIGPAYADVAKKYKNTDENVAMLVSKVIAGGQGNWGEIPMSAHPNLSNEDAEAMVKYILSIK
jgi:cytochrome c